jgi:GNAT superfamily N-acetyltransferase
MASGTELANNLCPVIEDRQDLVCRIRWQWRHNACDTKVPQPFKLIYIIRYTTDCHRQRIGITAGLQSLIGPRQPRISTQLRLVQDAYNDLRERHGLPSNIAFVQPLFQTFSLTEPSSSLWVAVADGTLQGFAFSWMRQKFWFLAQLFVRPGVQAKGIGQTILSKTLRHAEENSAENRALITTAYNLVSTALYIRNGLYPHVPLLRLVAAVDLLKQPVVTVDLDLSPIAIHAENPTQNLGPDRASG